MLTALNCYVLWGLTWLQFLTTLGCFYYNGLNLWFYVVTGHPLGLTIPESFLAFSIALSLFAIGAVTGSTLRAPRLWKRLLTVGVFAALAIGLSCFNLHLRHLSYRRAIDTRAEILRGFGGHPASGSDPGNEWLAQDLQWRRSAVERYDELLSQYRAKYGLDDSP